MSKTTTNGGLEDKGRALIIFNVAEMERRDSTVAVTIATVSAAVDEGEELSTKECDFASDDFKIRIYPFAVVLRIRVLQVVCGITCMVMGTVGFIEERGRVNLGLGVPAGAATVIAAGVSIHTSRGFGGYKPSCSPGSWVSRLRFLGPSVSAASALVCVWTTAFLLHITLVVFATSSILQDQWILLDSSSEIMLEDDEWNSRFMAAIILVLSIITLLSVVVLLRVDCLYDPD